MNEKFLRILVLTLCFFSYYLFFYGLCGASGYGTFEFEEPLWASHTCPGKIIYSFIEIFYYGYWELQAIVRYIYWPLNFGCLLTIWVYRVKFTIFVKKIYDSI